MSRATGRLGRPALLPAGALLAFFTLALAAQRGPQPTLPGPFAWCELLLPRLTADDRAPNPALFDAPAPPRGFNLVSAAPAAPPDSRAGPGSSSSGPPSPYLGLLPPLLALFALLAGHSIRGGDPGPGRPGPAARVARWSAGLALVVLGLTAAAPTAFAAIAWGLAVWGLVASSRPREPDETGLATLLLGAASVILAGLLAGLALSGGASPDRELLAPLLERLQPSEREAWTPTLLALNATHVRAVLDRSALAAFVGMAALLLHLKARRTTTGLLVVAAIAADLASAAPAGSA
jgi:hypothetical protein